MNIYVGNLPYQITEEELKTAFEEYGEVASVKIIIDRETGRSKGFAFVEMSDNTQGGSAIEELDGAELLGRTLRVNEARPRPERDGSGGGGNRGGGGGGRGNFNRRPREDRDSF